ncbi:MAG: type IX secretion system membrane protein PorP/SprF, partial [Bacteroidota bacterium]
MKQSLYLLILVFSFSQTQAQQTSRIAQAAEEFGSDNPAALSIEEILYRGANLSLRLRNQWWDFQTTGYPQTQSIAWLDNRAANSHYGATLIADKIGETRQYGLAARYARTLADGLKLGGSAGIFSQRIYGENLDVFDPNDPLLQVVGETRWRMSVSAGVFYSSSGYNQAWKWFAGAALRRAFFTGRLPGATKSSAETDLLAQGGLGKKGWWIASRLRLSLEQPSAFDLYVRKYVPGERFYLGAIATTDQKRQTAGIQAGGIFQLKKAGGKNDHFLTVNLGFSKPLSKYVYGSQLIFDAHVAWTWQKEE